MSDLREGGDIGHAQGGIGHGLGVEHLGSGLHGCLDLSEVIDVDEADLEPALLGQVFVEKRVGAPVERVAGDAAKRQDAGI